jgi:alkylhydroperoxidase family enzyme
MGLIARVTAPKTQTGNVIRDSAMGLVPETVDAFAVLNKSVWKSEHVRPAMLEMVRLRNARTVNCVFCKSVRYDIAKADGLSEDKVDNIADGYEDSNLSDMEKAALAFTDAYLFDPKGVTPELKARLKATFTEAQIATLAVALATFNASSRCAVSLGGMPESLPVMEISVPQ